ncbi:hypothetical protein E8E14_014900 [Neopestalotiopsis sp. 37M]|nr:hypothetical protein E8E14_014900 [Neopestalotiopsis sp. 37M]
MATPVRKVKAAFASPQAFKESVRVPDAPIEGSAYFNEDLLPTPPEKRIWNTLHFFAYYLTQTFSSSSYNLGATLISIGLQWYHAMIAAVIGAAGLSVVVILNSRGATRYHVGFPVYARASSGIGGSRLFVAVRASVAVIYFATQSYYGGRITSVCLRAIFGSSWENIPNTLPDSAGITSKNLLGFFIFWIVQFPVMFVHPTILRHLFVIKAVYTTVALFALGHQLGPSDSLPSPGEPAGRRSVVVMFVSCATTSASSGFLGKSYWNVWDLYDAILTQYWSPGARAGIFFVGFGMVLAQIATNAGSNSLPVGADSSGLWPRYINIVRGQVICALLAPLCVPWKIIASATTFLTFLGSYTVFLMPICGIMVVDYWVIRRGNFHVPSLYTKDPGTIYRYYHGWNPRALAAWVAGVAFTVHGIAGALDASAVNTASKNMYKLGFILSFLMGSLVYYVLNLIWPVPIYPEERVGEGQMTFEYMADSEGFFAGESVEGIRGVLSGEGVNVVSEGGDEVRYGKGHLDEKTEPVVV